jgi:predicted dehydrogenase/aryl-alcohol dehydrogenase-like predicted oxidoreductase
MQSTRIRWGIIATGAIGTTFARGLKMCQTGQLYAVASRSQEKAEAFAREWGAHAAYSSYQALLDDPQVQAVYISTPHPMHAEWAIRAAEAKKHVLVEKPFAINFAQAMAMTEAAIVNDVLMMEAFMYRCHPQTARLVELLKSKAIGDVRVIQATFSFHAGFNPNGRIFNNALAGGGILDVGCYTVSMSRLIAGAATGKDFADPTEVRAAGHLGQTGTDEWAVASLKFPGEILAQLSTGVSVNQENVVRIFGSEGRITLPNPWQANRTAPEPGQILIQRNDEKQPREITIEASATSFAYEADVFGNALLSGKKQAPSPAMSRDDTLGNIRTLDAWRNEIGLVYDFETLAHYPTHTVSGRPLQHPANPHTKPGPSGPGSGDARSPGPKGPGFASMKYASIPFLDKPVSRLVMGVDNQDTLPHAAVMFDDFFERGGNTFDTAFVYNPTREKLLGEWIKLRGVRDQVVVITKGAHTPFCDPKSLTRQLLESLDHLQLDFADIYMMHRDNLEIPASEFVDCLNEHLRAGRIKCFGGSNWSTARIDEANAYAQKTNQRGFTVVSNNFSLARMVDAPWKGCISSSDPDSRAWFTRTQTPLLAWSSQARGFFLEGRAHPDKKDDAQLVRCWYSEDNFRRLERVNEMAKKRSVMPINIALAYVLHQPFPTIALIGPRQLNETRTSMKGLEIDLTPDEVKWLNLEI